MSYFNDYQDLFLDFAKKNKLDDDILEWPQDLQDEFFDLAQELTKKVESEVIAQSKKPANEKYPEDFYTFTMIVDSPEGAKDVKVDVREMSIEELSDLCVQLPNYYSYYVDRLVESL